MSRYETLEEVRKHDSEAKTLEEVLKFNPYHDALGRFSSANGAHSFTIRTNSPAGQKAIANIKAKQQAAAGGGGSSSGSTKPAEQKQQEQPAKPKYLMGATAQKGHKTAKYTDKWDDVGEETYDKVAKDLHVSKEKAKDMAVSVSKYSGSYYDDIRAASRGESHDEYDKKCAQDIEEFIAASPKWEGGRIYRGVGINDRDVLDKIIQDAWHKKPIDMRGMSSWSSKKSIAQSFGESNTQKYKGGKTVMFITNGKTSGGKGTSIKHLSQLPHENEVLMSKEAVFTPSKITTGKDGTIYIYGDFS